MALLTLFSACKSPTSPEPPAATTGKIGGIVTDAKTGATIIGASVSTEPATSTVTTDAVGKYTINNVPPKSYTVTASASNYVAGSVNVTVTAGQTATANLALQPVPKTGTINGTVTDAGTGGPISGASVSTQPATATVTTDSQGKYTINDVTPSSYKVTASAGGYVSANVDVTVTAGQTTTANLALQANYSGSWSGTTSQGKPISFIIVDNAFTQVSFGWAISGTGWSSSGTTTINYSSPKPISGNTFTISGSTSFGYPTTHMNYTFNGTFNTPTTASGTETITFSGAISGTISGTWTASKS
jgi:hypothetical protein